MLQADYKAISNEESLGKSWGNIPVMRSREEICI